MTSAGREIGSALIDIQMQKYLCQRLELARGQISSSPHEVAEEMMLGMFERFKCSFGTPGTTVPKLFLTVPGLRAGMDIPHAGIKDSQIEISHETIKPFFDHQVEGLIKLIEGQLQSLQRLRPSEEISYLMLSGGLASSEYIQSRLQSHFGGHFGSLNPNARKMRLLLAENM